MKTNGAPPTKRAFLVGWIRKGGRGYYYVSPEAKRQLVDAKLTAVRG